jgi:mRNA interferase MazF
MSNPQVPADPQRGEIWWVNFHPQKGQEVTKRRPALVVGEPKLGNWSLRIVVPVLEDHGRSAKCPWFVQLPKNQSNGLFKSSEIDASQVKSISTERFSDRLGYVSPSQMRDVIDAIVLCLGYELPEQV